MTTRRDVLLTLTLPSVHVTSRAQAAKPGATKRFGYLGLDSDSNVRPDARPFFVALRAKGWIVGENLVSMGAFADWKAERLAALAEELVRQRPDVILARGPAATVAAARATKIIPIVFTDVGWPVEQGLIDSLAHPGRNATGFTTWADSGVGAKRHELLREIAPAARRVSVVAAPEWISVEAVDGHRVDNVVTRGQRAAQALGLQTRFHTLAAPQDVDALFDEITAWGAQAIDASGMPAFVAHRRIAELALHHRLPSAFLSRDFVEAGGLFSYGAPPSELALLSSRMVGILDRILRGAHPADIPVERPSRYELVLNMKTAKALGLSVPRTVLARADEIIE